jgi:hypothetical protein
MHPVWLQNLSRHAIIGVFVVLLAGFLEAATPTDRLTSTQRVSPLRPPLPGRAGFISMPPTQTGIHFTNTVAESRSLTNHILLNGSGVAAGDIDGDGMCDLYFCNLDGPNALYRNLGNWTFENIAAIAGVQCPGWDATGAALADLDGDGDLDLLVSAIRRGVSCFLNDGKGRFQDITSAAGLSSTTGAMSIALADIDDDGDLDIYLANYRNETLRDAFQMQIRVGTVNGRRVVTRVNGNTLTGPELAGWVTLDDQGNIQENGQADRLYRNEGNARFTAVELHGGTFFDETGKPLNRPLFDWSLSAMFRDLNGDRAPDLYSCSDMASPDRIWLNRGDGRFQAASPLAFRKTSWFSMGIDVADIDRDGRDDLFVTDMLSRDPRLRKTQVSDHHPVFSQIGNFQDRPQTPRNTLFWNRGDGSFAEVAYAAGLEASDWSWSPVFLDVDLDGYEDLLITTGFERDVQDADIANELAAARQGKAISDFEALRMRARFPRLAQSNLAFRNLGNLRFAEIGQAWGFNQVGVSQGLALADLDGDGDLDVAINNMNAPATLYRNQTAQPRIAVRLRSSQGNSQGIGAKIRVTQGAVPQQQQEIQSGGRYLSSDDTLRVFAAGHITNQLTVEIVWRSGATSLVQNLVANSLLEVSEPPRPLSSPPSNPPSIVPIFKNISSALQHRHHETSFDDFTRQPLLPRRWSQQGPGIAWADLDANGTEELLIGSGRGGALQVYRSSSNESWTLSQELAQSSSRSRDITGILALPHATQGWCILWATSAWEASNPAAAQEGGLYWNSLGQPLGLSVSNSPASCGPLAASDVDADGELEVFVGGHPLPGRYPQSSPSRLFRRTSSGFSLDSQFNPLGDTLGIVNGAVFSDLEGDGFPELIVASDWGPIRIFRNTQGHWTPWDIPLLWNRTKTNTSALPSFSKLSQLTGWWNGVTSCDMDGDGRLDLVASNWGRNSKYQSALQQPIRLYSGDFSDTGSMDLVEAFYEPTAQAWMPWSHRGRIGAALPEVAQRFPTFQAFAQATINQLLGPKLTRARVLEAAWLDSTVFLNRTHGLEVISLPDPAQWAPAFGVVAADFNGDGFQDLFLGQNFFATEPETARYDAGMGLCLIGNGHGDFQSLTPPQSGIGIPGEQRSAAVADFDGDARPDLVVSQNGGATQLLKNVDGKPGLRLRLVGPIGNPTAIGAVIRLRFTDRLGPAHELHAGSGYWAQDGHTLILATPTPPSAIEIQWPGGRSTVTSLESPPHPAGHLLTIHSPDGKR